MSPSSRPPITCADCTCQFRRSLEKNAMIGGCTKQSNGVALTWIVVEKSDQVLRACSIRLYRILILSIVRGCCCCLLVYGLSDAQWSGRERRWDVVGRNGPYYTRHTLAVRVVSFHVSRHSQNSLFAMFIFRASNAELWIRRGKFEMNPHGAFGSPHVVMDLRVWLR